MGGDLQFCSPSFLLCTLQTSILLSISCIQCESANAFYWNNRTDSMIASGPTDPNTQSSTPVNQHWL
ncbi:hypothetical protein QVD17_25905 [Tagetes erecta]|uniref:Secreted protein n=1 Tax=Tagetes erecta TaxID=13708 RepID=A0AAD8K6G4_TARER|nr:hypothetical protein QVD17_25905 [Tagetes erecta]